MLFLLPPDNYQMDVGNQGVGRAQRFEVVPYSNPYLLHGAPVSLISTMNNRTDFHQFHFSFLDSSRLHGYRVPATYNEESQE